MSTPVLDFPSFLGWPSASCSIPETFHQPLPEEEAKVQSLIEYFGKEGYDVTGSEKDGLTEWEMMFLVSCDLTGLWIQLTFLSVKRRDHPVPHRWAKGTYEGRDYGLMPALATKWDEDATIKRLEKCLAWRRKEEIDDIDLISNKVEAEVSCSVES